MWKPVCRNFLSYGPISCISLISLIANMLVGSVRCVGGFEIGEAQLLLLTHRPIFINQYKYIWNQSQTQLLLCPYSSSLILAVQPLLLMCASTPSPLALALSNIDRICLDSYSLIFVSNIYNSNLAFFFIMDWNKGIISFMSLSSSGLFDNPKLTFQNTFAYKVFTKAIGPYPRASLNPKFNLIDLSSVCFDIALLISSKPQSDIKFSVKPISKRSKVSLDRASANLCTPFNPIRLIPALKTNDLSLANYPNGSTISKNPLRPKFLLATPIYKVYNRGFCLRASPIVLPPSVQIQLRSKFMDKCCRLACCFIMLHIWLVPLALILLKQRSISNNQRCLNFCSAQDKQSEPFSSILFDPNFITNSLIFVSSNC